MTDQQLAIEAMASDLKRVALGLHRNSPKMAERFFLEALKRKNEIMLSPLPDYLVKIMQQINCTDMNSDRDRVAEDCLMYSTLLQNFAKS